MDIKRHRRRAYALREQMIAMRPPIILLAEDDTDVRQFVATALRRDGYAVVEARDGEDLCDQIGSALLFGNVWGDMHPVAVVISDIRMPGQNGLEILADLRAADVGVAMILMTAYPDPEVHDQAMRLGADAFLRKPFEVDDLLALVHGIAPTHGAAAESPVSWRAIS